MARRLTMEQVESLTLNDIPEDFLWKLTIGRARRYVWVRKIRARLDQCQMIFAVNASHMNAKLQRELGEIFPSTVDRGVIKNSIMKKACEGTEWKGISEMFETKDYCPLMWFFVKKEDDVKPCIDIWMKYEKKHKRAAVLLAAQEKVSMLTSKYASKVDVKDPAVCAMLRDDWKVFGPAEIPKIKDLPTKLEVIANIAGAIKQVPTKLARSTKQITQKIAIGTKKIVEKMEEGSKATVGDLL